MTNEQLIKLCADNSGNCGSCELFESTVCNRFIAEHGVDPVSLYGLMKNEILSKKWLKKQVK